MFKPLQNAKITAREFATLLDMSRITVHNWLAGRSSPHKLVAAKVAKTLEVLDALVGMKKLPLPADLSTEERAKKILKLKDIVGKHIND